MVFGKSNWQKSEYETEGRGKIGEPLPPTRATIDFPAVI